MRDVLYRAIYQTIVGERVEAVDCFVPCDDKEISKRDCFVPCDEKEISFTTRIDV
jgi:hypothetical protein